MSRRFQFSLKWLFALMFLVSAIAAKAHYDRQAEVARIKAELKDLRHAQAIYYGRVPGVCFCGPVRALREVDAKIEETEKRLKTLRGH